MCGICRGESWLLHAPTPRVYFVPISFSTQSIGSNRNMAVEALVCTPQRPFQWPASFFVKLVEEIFVSEEH